MKKLIICMLFLIAGCDKDPPQQKIPYPQMVKNAVYYALQTGIKTTTASCSGSTGADDCYTRSEMVCNTVSTDMEKLFEMCCSVYDGTCRKIKEKLPQ